MFDPGWCLDGHWLRVKCNLKRWRDYRWLRLARICLLPAVMGWAVKDFVWTWWNCRFATLGLFHSTAPCSATWGSTLLRNIWRRSSDHGWYLRTRFGRLSTTCLEVLLEKHVKSPKLCCMGDLSEVSSLIWFPKISYTDKNFIKFPTFWYINH